MRRMRTSSSPGASVTAASGRSIRKPIHWLAGVSTEMSLHVLAYHFKRVLNIVGTGALVETLKA